MPNLPVRVRKFLDYGNPRRSEAECPWCGSLERHRLVWQFFHDQTDLFDGRDKTVLHVAPEPCLHDRLQSVLKDGYITADLLEPGVKIRMDITQIDQADETYDVIYCSHVLEHVSDDRRAISEFHRVLKSGGWAVLLVPITAENTIEDPSISDPAERLRLFGQVDHVRRYGPDYVDRLVQAGFGVVQTSPSDFLATSDLRRMRVDDAAGDIFYCTKQE